MAESVRRLPYLDSFVPMAHCRPVEPDGRVSPAYLPSPLPAAPLRGHVILGESSLTDIAPEPAVRGLYEPLQVHAPGVVHTEAGVAPVWARLETSLGLGKASDRVCGGLFLPRVSVSTLLTGFVLDDPPTESPGGHPERRGVVIPFHELAAAASHASPKASPAGLRRMGS